jgi:hypothetical protein
MIIFIYIIYILVTQIVHLYEIILWVKGERSHNNTLPSLQIFWS